MEETTNNSDTLHLRFITSLQKGIAENTNILEVMRKRFSPLDFALEDEGEKYELLVVADNQPLFNNRGVNMLAMKQFTCGYLIGCDHD